MTSRWIHQRVVKHCQTRLETKLARLRPILRSCPTLACALLASCAAPTPAPTAALSAEPASTATPEPVDQSWREQQPAALPELRVQYPATVEVELATGLKLYWVKQPARVAALSFVALGGAARLDLARKGLSALTARMMTEESQHFSGRQLTEAVEALGTSLEYQAGRESTSFSLQVLRRDLGRGLELLADVVRNPSFRASTLQRIQREWIDSLGDDRQAPQTLAALAGFRATLGADLGLPTRGTPQSIARLEVADLQSYHQQVFLPESSALVVIADIELAELTALATQAFDSWQPTAAHVTPRKPTPRKSTPHESAPRALPTEPGGAASVTASRTVYIIDRPGAVQTAVFVACPFPGRRAGNYEAAQVMNNALGGLFSSRLNRNLREEHGYTYGAFSSLVTAKDWGMFFAASSVRTEVSAQALSELWGELGRIQQEVGRLAPDELTRAKTDLIRQLGASLEDVDRVANNVEIQFVQQLGVTYFEQLPELYVAVDDSMTTAAARKLESTGWVTVLVGDRSAIEEPLGALGYPLTEFPMAWLD